MPWKETDVRKERVKFVLEWERQRAEGRPNVAELCRIFGVSRDTGHRLIQRYQRGGYDVRAVEEHSRRPYNSPSAVTEAMQDVVIRLRKKRPRWGPRKLRELLLARNAEYIVPSASAIGDILKRHGLSRPRAKRRHSSVPRTQPFAGCTRPNAVWCVDFKGQFRTRNGKVCYPLTIMDAFSRYLLGCEVLLEPDGPSARRVFDSVFREFGLPDVIRSDNGPPFATPGAGGLSQLSIWWIKLGIRPERIEPGKPQQNGRHERMHRTLKLEAASPPRDNPRAQQRACDIFRKQYNEERPREALGGKPPVHFYQRSMRSYPRPLFYEYDVLCPLLLVNPSGFISWYRKQIFISAVLAREHISLIPIGGTLWEVRFAHVKLGTLDADRLERGLKLPIRRRRLASVASTPAMESAAAGDKLRLPTSCLDNPAGCPHSPQPPPPPISDFDQQKVSGMSSD
jgi:transposase InsO family protein